METNNETFWRNPQVINDEQGLDSLAHKQVLTEKSFGKVRMEAATRELSLRLKREITAGDIKTRALQHENLVYRWCWD